MSQLSPQQYMENWLLQINYPEVSIQMSINNSHSTVSFKQSRFVLNDVDVWPESGIFSPFG